MVAPVRIDSNLDTILFFALKKLIDDGVCTSATGFIGQNIQNNWVPPSTSYYVVKGESQGLVNAETNLFAGRLTVRANCYSSLDIAMRDTLNLTRKLPALLQSMVNKVADSLNLCDLNNGSVWFLAIPMRIANQDASGREVDRSSNGMGWTWCDTVFDIQYGYDPTYFNPTVNNVQEFTDEYDGSYQ